jgi:peptide deformylase
MPEERPITLYGDPVLHRPCAEVTAFDDAEGVGLAANQIGVGQRIFVFDCSSSEDSDGDVLVGHIVNPVLAAPKGRRYRATEYEGCLSIPGPHAELARADLATVTGFDQAGQPLSLRGTGLLARCFQHEVDHLNGVVYVDRLGRKQRRATLAEAGLTERP